jgi:hypothetical protein
MLQPISAPTKKVVAALLALDFARVADSVKDIAKLASPMRHFLWRGFLNPSPAVQSHQVSVVLATTPVVKVGW